MCDILPLSLTWLHFLVFLIVVIGSAGTPLVLVLSVLCLLYHRNKTWSMERRRGTAGAGSGERTDVGFHASGCCSSLSGWRGGNVALASIPGKELLRVSADE